MNHVICDSNSADDISASKRYRVHTMAGYLWMPLVCQCKETKQNVNVDPHNPITKIVPTSTAKVMSAIPDGSVKFELTNFIIVSEQIGSE